MIVRSLVLFVFIALLNLSCTHHDEPSTTNKCGVADPAEDLPWLKLEIEENKKYDYVFVEQGEYQGQTVFIFNNCCSYCNTIIPVYNCNGDHLFNLSEHEITKRLVIWKPEGSTCLI